MAVSDRTKRILAYLPDRIADSIREVFEKEAVEEIRIRTGQKIQLCFCNCDRLISCFGLDETVTQKECDEVLERICFRSVYAVEDQLREGYVTLPGGIRIGMAGKVISDGAVIRRIDRPTAFNIRIARECKGCASHIMPFLQDIEGQPISALIISPPGCGKTTLLRDIARQYSYGSDKLKPRRVCIIDERSEIAGCWEGVAECDLGPRCDILDRCAKVNGILLAIRTLSPEVIICDELGGQADYRAIKSALHSGCAVYASVHASNFENYESRSIQISDLYFERYLILSRRNGSGTIEKILDRYGKVLFTERSICRI